MFLDPLFLQASEKGLRDSVVPAVRFTTHAGLEAVGATEPSPRIAAILGAMVRVNHRAARASCSYGLEHRIEHQLAVDRGDDGQIPTSGRLSR